MATHQKGRTNTSSSHNGNNEGIALVVRHFVVHPLMVLSDWGSTVGVEKVKEVFLPCDVVDTKVDGVMGVIG